MNGPIQSMADPMSSYNMSLRSLREAQKRASKKESDLINERYYKSMASSNNIFSPSTPTSLALEKRCAERWEQYDRRFNTSSSSNLMKAIKSLFSWR
ncbi:MAG: hypothetical protein ACRDAI_05815 [Candidatus Rhabdochlamydia sp.]